MPKHIEFIEDYIHDGDDYIWFDNHGELIRCRECKHKGGEKKASWCDKGNRFVTDNDYCSLAERADDE